MAEPELTAEERALRMMKRVLTNIAKDTAPRPGQPRHPLSEETVQAMRECLRLITEREQELARLHKRDTSARPRFIDEPASEFVVSLDSVRKNTQADKPTLSRLGERLLASTARDQQSGCWNWTGQISNSGHGRIMVKQDDGENRIISAEYASYQAFIGPIPDDMMVRQTCHNPLCINPQHLELLKHNE